MNLLIYNPAAQYGGAESVLRGFIDSLSDEIDDNYYILTSIKDIKSDKKNIKIIYASSSYASRLYWEYFGGLRKLVNRYNLDAILSLQNSLNSKTKANQYVYCHNVLPLLINDKDIDISKKLKVKMWMIKKMIKSSIAKTEIFFVQTETFKKQFMRTFNINSDKIKVVYPKVEVFLSQKTSGIEKLEKYLKEDQCNYIGLYVASDLEYKNHKNLLKFLKKYNEKYDKKVKIYLTLDVTSWVYEYAKEAGLDKYLRFLGYISKNEIMYLYENVKTLFFPSTVESFPYPLTEAMKKNCPIIAEDTEFAREICGDYAQYFNFKDSKVEIDILERESRGESKIQENLNVIDIIRKYIFM